MLWQNMFQLQYILLTVNKDVKLNNRSLSQSVVQLICLIEMLYQPWELELFQVKMVSK